MPSLESLANDLVECPPGQELSDKYFLGFWDKERLVAILDLIDGYPTAEIAYIGLFMVGWSGSWLKDHSRAPFSVNNSLQKDASRLCRKQSSVQSFLVQSWILSNWRGQRVGWKKHCFNRI